MRNQVSGYFNAVKEGNNLFDFVHSGPFPIDIKDYKTGKYIANNEAAAVVSGLKSTERLGLDIYDIGRINGLKESAIEKVVQADRSVSPEKPPVSFVHIFVDKTQETILIDRVVKKAVLNQSNHMTGILSYAQDIAPYTSRGYLYTLYKTYYPVEVAIQKFLNYLKLDHCFLTLPTEQELYVLLTLYYQKEVDAISEKLAIPPAQVQEYQAKLKEKLAIIEYDEIIMQLNVPVALHEPTHIA
jgi:hypothetical protein